MASRRRRPKIVPCIVAEAVLVTTARAAPIVRYSRDDGGGAIIIAPRQSFKVLRVLVIIISAYRIPKYRIIIYEAAVLKTVIVAPCARPVLSVVSSVTRSCLRP